MSIRSPASSRWSRPVFDRVADRRAGPRPRARRPSGRAGSAASRAAPAARPRPSARRSPSALTSPDSALQPRRAAASTSRRSRLPAATSSEAAFCSARRPSAACAASRQRASSSSTRSTRSASSRPAPRQRRANRVGLATDQPEVEHDGAAVRLSPLRRSSRPGVCARSPAYLARNSATACFSLAGDDVLGHDRAGEAAVLDRVQRRPRRSPCGCRSSGRRRSPCRSTLSAEPCVPADVERVAGAAALGEQHAPRRGVGSSSATSHALRAAAARRRAPRRRGMRRSERGGPWAAQIIRNNASGECPAHASQPPASPPPRSPCARLRRGRARSAPTGRSCGSRSTSTGSSRRTSWRVRPRADQDRRAQHRAPDAQPRRSRSRRGAPATSPSRGPRRAREDDAARRGGRADQGRRSRPARTGSSARSPTTTTSASTASSSSRARRCERRRPARAAARLPRHDRPLRHRRDGRHDDRARRARRA